MKTKTVPINSNVLRWAIGGSGWDIKELSDETGISLDSIDMWVNKNSAININDLQKISKKIGRPLSILLLLEPPIENNLPYYRRIGGIDSAKTISRDTLTAIRNARYVQSNARKLLEILSEDVQPHITLRTLGDDPEMVSVEERSVLGLDTRERLKGDDINQFVQMEYKLLREKIESFNILVMQAGMDVKEVRGFTLLDDNPKLILINSRDEMRPRLFTLLHEYAHLLLDTDGICLIDLNDNNNNKERDEAIERWCNNFAGAVIMPKRIMLKELDDRAGDTPQQVVDSLSTKFCSSKTATVVRILNLIGDDSRKKDYLGHYRKILSKSVPKLRGGGGSGGRSMAKECIDKNGRWYAKLVSNSRDREIITTRDMVRYLGLKTKHFDNLKELI